MCENLEGCLHILPMEGVTHAPIMFLSKDEFSYLQAEGEQAWAGGQDCCKHRAFIPQVLEGLRGKALSTWSR